MYHNQFQQVQQKINTVQQMVSNLRQSEQSNQQKLQQLAQEEAYASQQLQRVQQLCQEVVSNLQNITMNQPVTGMAMQGYTTPSEIAHFGSQQGTFAGSFAPTTQGYQGYQGAQGSTLFDPTTMGASTYQGTAQTFGHVPGMSGSQQFAANPAGVGTGAGGMSGMSMGQTLPTSTSLSDFTTMKPDTYLASRQQLGRSATSPWQTGQQAGIGGIGATSMISGQAGAAGNIGSFGGGQLSNIATMSPDTYQASQQQLGGTSSSLSQIGQQAGISTSTAIRGF